MERALFAATCMVFIGLWQITKVQGNSFVGNSLDQRSLRYFQEDLRALQVVWIQHEIPFNNFSSITSVTYVTHPGPTTSYTGHILLFEKMTSGYELIFKESINYDSTAGTHSVVLTNPPLVGSNHVLGFAYSQSIGPISMGFTAFENEGTLYKRFDTSSDSNLVIGDVYATDSFTIKNYVFSIGANILSSDSETTEVVTTTTTTTTTITTTTTLPTTTTTVVTEAPATENTVVTGDKGEKGEKGTTGQKGEKGNIGGKGIKGEKGDKGQKGNQGEKGDKGYKGDKGFKGEKGLKGDKGDTGLKGNVGEKGQKGSKGVRGERGVKGEKGVKGVIGEKGDKGERGEKGDKGETGFKGSKGEKGVKGQYGEKGDKGMKGDKGEKGNKGEKGDKGEKGNKGDKGYKGEKGDKGNKGDKGEEGGKGVKGNKGERGIKGEKGGLGEKGDKGLEGDKGNMGDKGDLGVKGAKGDSYVNLCENNNGGCTHNCHDATRNRWCSCNEGYKLDTDNATCVDIDECTTYRPCDQECTDYPGTYNCSCFTGFEIDTNDSSLCIDVDECNISSCNADKICVNTYGSYVCLSLALGSEFVGDFVDAGSLDKIGNVLAIKSEDASSRKYGTRNIDTAKRLSKVEGVLDEVRQQDGNKTVLTVVLAAIIVVIVLSAFIVLVVRMKKMSRKIDRQYGGDRQDFMSTSGSSTSHCNSDRLYTASWSNSDVINS